MVNKEQMVTQLHLIKQERQDDSAYNTNPLLSNFLVKDIIVMGENKNGSQ